MKPLFSNALRVWATMALVISCLMALAANAQEASEAAKVEVPATQNPYLQVVATLYDQSKHEEALSKLEKALERKSNSPQEVLFLKLMKGVLQAELGQNDALESFKEALALEPQAQLPAKASWRLRKLFEQARNTSGLPADEELLAEELEPANGSAPSNPPPKSYRPSVGVRVEADVLGPSVYSALVLAASLGYTREGQGGVFTVLVQKSPGLRAEWQLHPFSLGSVRPYARVGVTVFFRALEEVGVRTLRSGVSGRGSLGMEVRWNSRMFALADVAYDHFFFKEGSRYSSQSVVFSLGVGLFP